MAANKLYVPALVMHPPGIEIADGASKIFKFPYKEFVAILDVTASTGSAETLDVTIEEYNPASDSFFEFFAFGTAAADASQERLLENEDGLTPFGSLIRVVWDLVEASSTFTFSVTLHGKR